MSCVTKGIPSDKERIIDFGDYVFSKAHRPHDFASLLPKLYGPSVNRSEYHYIVKTDDEIRGMICAAPSQLSIGGETCHMVGIGTVSAHPKDKGKGYMKALMAEALADMKKTGADFSVLGGQRQRYEYFGYHYAGINMAFKLDKTNIRHCFGKLAGGKIQAVEVLAGDVEMLDEIYRLYASGPVIARTRENFHLISSTWYTKIFAVLKDNKVCGYFLRCNDQIMELTLKDWTDFPQLCVDVFGNETISVYAAPWEQKTIQALLPVCDSFIEGPHDLYQIFNYVKMIKALLEVKSGYCRLEQGVLKLKIGEQAMCISVSSDHHIKVEKIASEESEDYVILSEKEAMLRLFSPMGQVLGEQEDRFPRNWFPLPLKVLNADMI